MEQNREVKELPDRWIFRLAKSARPHGRIAVISSCATAGVLLIVGGVVFANSGDRTVTNLSSSPSTSVSSTDGNHTSPKGQTPSESTTSTMVPSSTAITRTLPSPENGSINPSTPSPTTPVVPGVITTTTIAPTPSTGAPPTSSPPSGPIATSSLSVNADWATQPTPDDPVVNLRVSASDSNGYIASIIVIWNDGTQTVVNNPNACALPLKSSFNTTVTHSYPSAGTYTVAATATSTDCGGATQQQLSRLAKSVTVGGSSPTTTPPPTTSTTAP